MLGGSMQACSAKGCYFGNVYSSHWLSPLSQTLHLQKTFSHNSVSLPHTCRLRENTENRAQMVLWPSRHQTPPPEACPKQVSLRWTTSKRPPLFSRVYGFMTALSVPARHQHDTLACLNLQAFVFIGPIEPLVPLLPAFALATSLTSDGQSAERLNVSISH